MTAEQQSRWLSDIAAAFPLPACGERARVRGNPKLGCKHPQHAVEITENLVIPNAAQIRRVIGMLSPIDLDDETLLAADKIDVVGPDRFLARKLYAAEPAVAKSQP